MIHVEPIVDPTHPFPYRARVTVDGEYAGTLRFPSEASLSLFAEMFDREAPASD